MTKPENGNAFIANEFQGVTNDDEYNLVIANKIFSPMIKNLESEKKRIDKEISDLKEQVKVHAAKMVFVSKEKYILAETVMIYSSLLKMVIEALTDGDMLKMETILNEAKSYTIGMSAFISEEKEIKSLIPFSNEHDILYDYSEKVYQYIKENNADSYRTNKELRELKIRKTDWLHFSGKE